MQHNILALVLGDDEQSPQSEMRLCNTRICCVFGEWSDWGPCDVTCQFGRQLRQRKNTCPEIDDETQVQVRIDEMYT